MRVRRKPVKFSSSRPKDRLDWWGAPMAHTFSRRLQSLAMEAAERWALRDPCPADVLERELGERWMEDHPGLASLVTSYHIGAED